jgi:hypothetical protein
VSYLHHPGLTFVGTFQADVPTGNNDPAFYDAPPPAGDPNNWNPLGGGQFRLLNAAVTGVLDDATTAADDPVRTAVVTDAVDRVAAKIVDLDPQYQLASELWGLRVRLVANGVELLSGEFEPAAFRDITFAGFHARFVSVLHDLRWAPPGTSGFVDRLRAATSGGMVAIRLVTFGFNGRTTLGSFVGAIGPHLPGEPHRFVAGRHFVSPDQGTVNDFDGVVDGDRLTVDLANSIGADPAAVPAGADVRLALLQGSDIAAGAAVTEDTDALILGDTLAFRQPGWLRNAGGLVTVPLPPAATAHIDELPLALISRGTPGQVLIRETANGWLARADNETRRLEPGGSATVPVHVTQYGTPARGVQLDIGVAPPSNDAPPTGSPPNRVRVATPAATGADGRTTLVITADPQGPGNPRGHIEGQLYFVTFAIAAAGQDFVVVHVYDAYTAPQHPTWFDNVRPILAPYAVQYPLMTKRVLDLGDYASVSDRRHILQLALSRPMTDPNYMPVTRDLSPAKQAMILRWLATPDLPMGIAPAAPAAPHAVAPEAVPAPEARGAAGGAQDEAPYIGKRESARLNADLIASREPRP